MSFDPYEFDRDYGQSSRMESIGQYTAKTFLWMVLGLLVTFGIALLGWVTNATLYALAYVPYIHLIVLIATIVLSFTMVSRIEKMSVGTARGIFIAFSAQLLCGLPRHAGEGVYFLRPSVVPGFHQPVFVPAALFGQVPELSAPLNREREDLSHRQVLFSILFIDS